MHENRLVSCLHDRLAVREDVMQDDGWGDLALGTASAKTASTAELEAALKAKAELEQKLYESEEKSQELHAELACLQEGMSAGSDAIARVAELEGQLRTASELWEQQQRESQVRISELEKAVAMTPTPSADIADQAYQVVRSLEVRVSRYG